MAGVDLVLDGTTVANNSAGAFGGGLMLGDLTTQHTCVLTLVNGAVVAGNAAVHSGAQVYDDCRGALTVNRSTVHMTADNSQVCLVCVRNGVGYTQGVETLHHPHTRRVCP